MKWPQTTLDKVCTVITDGTHKTPKYKSSGVRFMSIKNIKPFAPVNWSIYEKYISISEHQELIKRAHPEKDDILFPRIGTLGYAKRIDFDDEVSIFVGLGLAKPDKTKILPKFLEYYMNTNFVDQYSRKEANGSGRLTLPLYASRRMPIPLPSLDEQEKIVAKIEELFSEIDNSTAHLTKISHMIDVLYQSRLKNIFMGTDGTCEVADSGSLYVSMLDYRKFAPNAKRLDLTPIQDVDLPDLGSRGFWASVDLLASNDKHSIKAGPFGSSLKKSMYTNVGYKLYGQEQVIRQRHDYGDYFIPEAKYQELIANKVRGGDVLISLVGTVGRVLVLPDEAELGIINPRLVKISFNPDHFLPKLFKYYFESQFVKNIYKLKTHGATMDVLNLGIIRTIPIPVFPLPKQREMLAAIEELQTEIENLRRELASYQSSSRTIKQAILSKAFKGELV